MQKKVNGKNKGSTFERKTANALSDRFSGYLGLDRGFRKSVDSGSFFGGTNQARTQTYDLDYAVFGDLICPKSFKFSIECKHYKTAPSFQSIITHKVTQWDGWLQQAVQDSLNAKKQMALIVKYNNVDEIVFLEHELPITANYSKYQHYWIYKLSDFLMCSDSYFFDVAVV